MTKHYLPKFGEPDALIYIAPGDTVDGISFLSEPTEHHAFLVYPAHKTASVARWYERVGQIVSWCFEQGLGDPYIWNSTPRENDPHCLPALYIEMPQDRAALFKLTFGGAA